MSNEQPPAEPPAQPPAQPSAGELAGLRVLVVEDSPVVAEACDDMLRDMGIEVVGPATNMALALQMAEDEPLDAAIVDVNIRGGKAYPVLRILHRRAVPFLLTSGYADWSMPEEWQHQPRLAKPYTPNQLRESLIGLVAASAPNQPGSQLG